MNKSNLLELIVNEYQDKVRRDGDFTLREFREEFRTKTGLSLGEKKSKQILDHKVASGELISLTVINTNGHNVVVWRKNERMMHASGERKKQAR